MNSSQERGRPPASATPAPRQARIPQRPSGASVEGLNRAASPQILGPQKRGRRPFMLPETVERGLLRFLDYTDVPFDDIADAVEQSDGPGKNWLRGRIQRIVGTNKVDSIRLRSKPEYASKRKEAQLAAIAAMPTARSGSSSNGFITTQRDEQYLEAPSPETSRAQPIDVNAHVSDPQHRQYPVAVAFPYGGGASTSEGEPGKDVPIHHEDIPVRDKEEPEVVNLPPLRTVAFAEDQFQPSTHLSSDSAPTRRPLKRRKTDDSQQCQEGPERLSYAKRRELAATLNIFTIARRLAKRAGASGPLIMQLARQLSQYAETLVSSAGASPACSRASTFGAPLRADMSFTSIAFMEVHTVHLSEYERWYHKPHRQTADYVADALSAEETTSDIPATSIILYAKVYGLPDEDAATLLKRNIPSVPDDATVWVNDKDVRGVSALHLTAAYGFETCSNFLVEANADCTAETNCGVSVHHFARAAQALAISDHSLYHRIMNIRQWVHIGQPPPVPQPSEFANIRHAHESDSVDATVPGAFDQSQYGRGSARLPTGSTTYHQAHVAYASDAYIDDDESAIEALGPDFFARLTDSPTSLRQPRGSMHSFSDVFDFAEHGSGQHSIRKRAAMNNLRRSPTALSLQPTSSSPMRDVNSGVSTTNAHYPTHLSHLHPSAVQSVPDLGYFNESLAWPPENLDTYPARGVIHNATPNALNMAHNSGFEGISNANLHLETGPNTFDTSLASGPAILPPAGVISPLSLLPDSMHSMATNGQVQQYQAFSGWQQGPQMMAHPTAQRPAPEQGPIESAIGLTGGPSHGPSVLSTTNLNGDPLQGASTQPFMLSGPMWFSCPHGKPMNAWQVLRCKRYITAKLTAR